jgi:hypothetical protein
MQQQPPRQFMSPQQWQQPPYPPQYQPPMPPPKKKIRKRLWLLVTAVFILAIVMGIASGGQSQQSAPATQKAIPTLQVSRQSQLQSIVQKSGAAYARDATVTYDTDFKYIHVSASFSVTSDNSLDIGRIKQDAFAIQRAIWQAHISGVDAVQVFFDSDDGTPLRLATCEVEHTTAVKLKWASLTSDQAWSSYDTTWLSPSL